MEKISANKVLFIKLGKGGGYDENCIEKENTLRLSYHEVDHSLCINKEWDKVRDYYISVEKTRKNVAASHANQIKQFYEEDDKTLWVTFYAHKLWWCFSKPEIYPHPDNTKTRPVIGKWSDKDINSNVLIFSNISGKLLRTQGFQGTICRVPASEYVLAKINGELLPEVVEVEKAMDNLKTKLISLIKHLQWQDFEILVDLIFRQAGWQRLSDLGKTQKTIDIEVLSPVTNERGIIQVKSQSDLKQFEKYQKDFVLLHDYNKFFYVVHTAEASLRNYENDTDIKLIFAEEIADLTIASGLVDWVVKKTS